MKVGGSRCRARQHPTANARIKLGRSAAIPSNCSRRRVMHRAQRMKLFLEHTLCRTHRERFFVRDMMDHFAHQFYEQCVAGGVFRLLLSIRSLLNTVASTGKNSFLRLRVYFQCRAGRIYNRPLAPPRTGAVISMECGKRIDWPQPLRGLRRG